MDIKCKNYLTGKYKVNNHFLPETFVHGFHRVQSNSYLIHRVSHETDNPDWKVYNAATISLYRMHELKKMTSNLFYLCSPLMLSFDKQIQTLTDSIHIHTIYKTIY